jgi:hypothetical protein
MSREVFQENIKPLFCTAFITEPIPWVGAKSCSPSSPPKLRPGAFALHTRAEEDDMAVKIISLTPVGYYAGGAPRYGFGTSYPSHNVRMAGRTHATPEAAYEDGLMLIRDYKSIDPFGNMGEVCGVVKVTDGFRAVINTYHSNT